MPPAPISTPAQLPHHAPPLLESVKLSPRALGWVVFVLGVFLSALTYFGLQRHEQSVLQRRVETLTASAENLVRQRFDLYQYGLRGMRGAVLAAGVDRFNRTAFDAYAASRDTHEEFPGARGFGVIRKVATQDQAQFVKNARADGAPDFRIRQLVPHDGDLFVIQYLSPKEGNEGATGLDIGSENNRRQAAIQASMSNKARMTRPITLVQADGQSRRGFLVLLPIYHPDMSLQRVEDRERATFGWSYAPLVVDEVLKGVQDTLREVSLTLTDAEETDPFYNSSSVPNDANAMHAQREIRTHGRIWQLKASSRPGMAEAAGLWSAWWALALGLPLSILAAWVAHTWRLKSVQPVPSLPDGEATDWARFVRTPMVVGWLWAYSGTLVLALALGLVYQWRQHLQTVATNMQLAVTRAAEVARQSDDAHRKAVAFLASASSSVALTHALSAAPNSVAPQQIEELRSDMASTLNAFMVSSPEIVQARVIGVGSGGLELVRVQRKGERVMIVPKADLQAKGGEPYMQSTTKLEPGQIYVSNLTLNREFGQVAQPHQPTLRYAAPLFTNENQLFGIVILNVDASAMLASLTQLAPHLGTMYTTNESGDFGTHPDPSRTFGSDHGHPYAWNKAFEPASLPWGINNANLTAWRDSHGLLLTISTNAISLGSAHTPGLKVVAGVPLSAVIDQFWQPVVLPTMGMLLLGLAGLLLLYGRWAQRLRANAHQREVTKTAQQTNDRMLFQGVLESAPEAMLLVDASGHIVLANARAVHLFGHPAHALLGQPVEMLLPPALASAHRAHFQHYTRAPQARFMGEGGNQALQARRANGEEFPVEVSLGPVQHSGQSLVVASVRDLTMQHKFEGQLRQAREAAEQSNQAKSAFLANMSHEIRTPLNAVIGLTGLLSEDHLNDQQRSYVSKIQLSGRALLGIVNDVLDLAKIEAEELSLELIPCQPAEVLTQLESVFSTQAKAKGLGFALTMDPQLPLWVMADCNRLGQVLTNLLGNALKFTASGQIGLSAEVLQPGTAHHDTHGEPPNGGPLHLKLAVTDTGTGIAPEALQRLFQPFSQADSSTARLYGGTGLGLSIVKRMVDLMGGEVGVESTPGTGSQFWVTLPLFLPAAGEIPDTAPSVEPVLVLLAEDDPDERTRLSAMTRSLGWQQVTVTNGAEMVSTFAERLASGKPNFDALIVDWQMPQLDGLSALTTLANEHSPQKLPAVLMISAHEREKIAALDVDHLVDQILSKPVDASQLFNSVNDIVTARTGQNMRVLQATRTEAIAARWLPGLRILVVDDNDLNLEVVTAILTRSGAVVTAVNSGQAALDCLARAPGDIDAVLMDVQMPGMDGLEATRRLRQHANLSTLPVIALTAGALLEEKRRALEVGMTDFLTKPIEPHQLITRLRLAVEHHRGKRVSIEPNLPVGMTQEPQPEHWPDIDGIDAATAARYLLGDIALFFTVLERMLATEIPQPAQTTEAHQANWQPAAAATIHALRGSAGTVGATRLHQLTSTAEATLRQTTPRPTDSLAALAAVRQELAVLKQASQTALAAWHQQQAQATLGNDTPALDDASVAELLNLLAQNDLSALERANEWAAPLRARLGPTVHDELCTLLNSLNFAQASALLQGQTRSPPPHTA